MVLFEILQLVCCSNLGSHYRFILESMIQTTLPSNQVTFTHFNMILRQQTPWRWCREGMIGMHQEEHLA